MKSASPSSENALMPHLHQMLLKRIHSDHVVYALGQCG